MWGMLRFDSAYRLNGRSNNKSMQNLFFIIYFHAELVGPVMPYYTVCARINKKPLAVNTTFQ